MDVVEPDGRASLEEVGARIVTLSDEYYPPLLREIHDPPEKLYVRGDPALLCRPQLAMVGSRRASAVGLRIAESFAAAASRVGLQVCSGLRSGPIA